MTVADLIAYLQTKPPDMVVIYQIYSEQCVLEAGDILTKVLCEPRADGWVENARPDKPGRQYLVFPGN